jgi:hypothetical protein
MAQLQLDELNAGNVDNADEAELAAVEADIAAVDRQVAQQTAEQMVIQFIYPFPEYEFYLRPPDERVYPCVELLWGGLNDLPKPDVFGQIWRVSVNAEEPATWLILATTFETHQLRLLYLNNGRSAQEGSRAYLEQALKLMSESPSAKTRDLAAQLSDALQQGRISYQHVHRDLDSATGEIGQASRMFFEI